MSMFGRFTERAQKAIYFAQEEAKQLLHNYVGTEHLLLGLIREKDGIAANVLINIGADLDTIRNFVVNLIGYGDKDGEVQGYTPRTKRVFELSFIEARSIGHNY